MSDALVSLITALADDELIVGHRHSEWTGFAPHLEEDVAFSSIAQDEIGHAAAYFGLLAKLTGDDPDRIALGRAKDQYRNATICERDNGDWAFTLARHWLYDTADDIRLEALESSSDDELSAVAVKVRREERYHLIHANAWMRRVAAGPVEGRTRLIGALSDALAEAPGLFEPVELEDDAIAKGWLPVRSRELLRRFRARVGSALDDLGLPSEMGARVEEEAEFVASSSGDLISVGGARDAPHVAGRGEGGRRGRHSEEFGELWEVMTRTYREHPGASW